MRGSLVRAWRTLCHDVSGAVLAQDKGACHACHGEQRSRDHEARQALADQVAQLPAGGVGAQRGAGAVTETWERQADLEPQLGPLELCDADGGGREDPDLLPADAAAQEGGSQEWSSSWAWSGTESRTAKAKAKGKAAQPKPKAKKGTAASGAKAQPKRPAKKPSKQ